MIWVNGDVGHDAMIITNIDLSDSLDKQQTH